jgi:hypothetical protein
VGASDALPIGVDTVVSRLWIVLPARVRQKKVPPVANKVKRISERGLQVYLLEVASYLTSSDVFGYFIILLAELKRSYYPSLNPGDLWFRRPHQGDAHAAQILEHQTLQPLVLCTGIGESKSPQELRAISNT